MHAAVPVAVQAVLSNPQQSISAIYRALALATHVHCTKSKGARLGSLKLTSRSLLKYSCISSFSSSDSSIKMPAESPAKRQKTEMEVDEPVAVPVKQSLFLPQAQPQTQVLKYAKISPDAFEPERKSEQAAGYDLFSNENTVVAAKSKALVKTDIKIALPEGCYGRIAPRSGLAVRNFIDVGAGVIDQDYRGNVKVLLFNFSDKDFEVKRGDRIAQLVCERIYTPPLVACESLDETDRGEGGFGSTGTN